MTDAHAAYQRALLSLLRDGASPEETRASLLANPDLSELREYIEQLNAHALVVARQLVARWGVP